jgi:hypothetical protein
VNPRFSIRRDRRLIMTVLGVAGVSAAATAFAAGWLPAQEFVPAVPETSCESAPQIEAVGNPAQLWPPHGQMVPVTVHGTVTAGANCELPDLVSYSVDDKYAEIADTGSAAVAEDGSFSFVVELPAWRRGNDREGRTFDITLTAGSDELEGTFAVGQVIVHDQRVR